MGHAGKPEQANVLIQVHIIAEGANKIFDKLGYIGSGVGTLHDAYQDLKQGEGNVTVLSNVLVNTIFSLFTYVIGSAASGAAGGLAVPGLETVGEDWQGWALALLFIFAENYCSMVKYNWEQLLWKKIL